MDYYSEVCDKTIKLKPKNNILNSLTHIQYEKSLRRNHTDKYPNLFDIDKIFNDFISNHSGKFDLYLFKCDFHLVFNSFTPYIKTDFYHNTSFIIFKGYLLYWIERFFGRRHKRSHNKELNNTTVIDQLNMTYDLFIQQPMQAIELKLNLIIAKNSFF